MSIHLPGFQTVSSFTGPKMALKPAKAGIKTTMSFQAPNRPSGPKASQPGPTKLTPNASGTEDSFKASKNGPKLAIIDDFKTPFDPAFVKQPNRFLMETPGNGWVTHGDIVEAHAKKAQHGIQIVRLETPRVRSLNIHSFGRYQADLPGALKIMKKRLETDRSIDAINISFGLPIPIKRLKKDLNLPDLNAQNIRKYRDVILENFDKIQFSRPLFGIKALSPTENHKRTYIREAMQLLEEIAKIKPVYLSAGNAGPDQFNILSLVKGVKSVGALNNDLSVASYSGNNGLVAYWAQVNQRFAPVTGKNGKLLGITLKEEPSEPINPGFIPTERLQMNPLGAGKWFNGLTGATINPKTLHGTSYAAPQVAAQKAHQIFWLKKLMGLERHQTP